MTKRVHNAREVAEIVAIQALSFVAAEPERLGAFLAESGIGPETLRSAADVGGWQNCHRMGIAMGVVCHLEEDRFEVFREADVEALADALRELLQRDVPALVGVIQPAVSVLLHQHAGLRRRFCEAVEIALHRTEA